MKLNATRIGRTVFNSAAVLALGFGALQAFAAPAKASAATSRLCDPTWCDNSCIANGANGGFCIDRYRCECW
jgi:hypothetical protein